VTTLDRLLPDVRLDEPEVLVHPPRDLREDIRGALVAELVGLIDGVTGTLTIGAQRRRERVDVVPLLLAASPLLQGIGGHYFEILLTNNNATHADQYVTSTYQGNPLSKNDLHIGFNIERRFGKRSVSP